MAGIFSTPEPRGRRVQHWGPTSLLMRAAEAGQEGRKKESLTEMRSDSLLVKYRKLLLFQHQSQLSFLRVGVDVDCDQYCNTNYLPHNSENNSHRCIRFTSHPNTLVLSSSSSGTSANLHSVTVRDTWKSCGLVYTGLSVKGFQQGWVIVVINHNYNLIYMLLFRSMCWQVSSDFISAKYEQTLQHTRITNHCCYTNTHSLMIYFTQQLFHLLLSMYCIYEISQFV